MAGPEHINVPRGVPMGTPAARRILVAEDDPGYRAFFHLALTKTGYVVSTAEDVASARALFLATLDTPFDCVITDYRMPDGTGLELLVWLKEQAPCLATIVVTAEGEKELVTSSLRGGAMDFLDKPVDLKKLRASVARAIEVTQKQRRLAESESAVKELGRVQAGMLGGEVSSSRFNMQICFHPKHEAGGDFITRFQPSADRFFCLLTDVSGHDLQAAYISAYFQGVVRGMLECAAPIPEIFKRFNQFLLEEWGQNQRFCKTTSSDTTSVAACGVLLDLSTQTATVLTHGTPAPLYYLPNGRVQKVGNNGGFPLGWFPDLVAQSVTHPFEDGGTFCLWTDGLEELAEKNGVSPLSLAYALQQAKLHHRKVATLDMATDDILLADLHLSGNTPSSGSYQPLLFEEYHGGQTVEIDQLQAYWQRSLILAVPEMTDAWLYDILLASREILLNALKHGCEGSSSKTAAYQFAYSPAWQTLRVRVCDSGRGHQFNLSEHEIHAATKLAEAHRGLILVKHLARSVTYDNHGTCVTMEFPNPDANPRPSGEKPLNH